MFNKIDIICREGQKDVFASKKSSSPNSQSEERAWRRPANRSGGLKPWINIGPSYSADDRQVVKLLRTPPMMRLIDKWGVKGWRERAEDWNGIGLVDR